VVAAGQDALLPAARDLLKGLHWERAEIASEADITPSAVTGRDLLLLGWPQLAELRPQLPSELTVAGGTAPGWQVCGMTGASDTLFAVLAGRQTGDGRRALLLASSPEAVRRIAAKIPHYGRYSLLLFANGSNIVKQTWEAPVSPLRIVFPKEPLP